MKSDVEIEKWSELRGDLETVQGASITFRVSRDELAAIKIAAFDRRCRMSDIIRASLIYAGVIAKPTADAESDGANGAAVETVAGASEDPRGADDCVVVPDGECANGEDDFAPGEVANEEVAPIEGANIKDDAADFTDVSNN